MTIQYHKGFEVYLTETKTLFCNPDINIYRYIKADSEQKAKEYVEEHIGNFIEIHEELEFIDGKTKLSDLENGKEYTMFANQDYTNEIIVIEKRGEWVYTALKGGEFRKCSSEQGYNLKEVVRVMVELGDYPDCINFETLTLKELEDLDSEIYNTISCYDEIPKNYEGIVK
ncbi:hypothetical protein COF68_05755 [Bacillus toyonensis]|uniref:hypothetical protein n=1 Tax=Bacillus toyonensis TaxID=155322 RepID=UPI000BFC5F87|nr:hypothetical protein [Bacillus toyonensis]PHE64345.1 hypothetical protein COF68_05755 [Bacillus toyonensis]